MRLCFRQYGQVPPKIWAARPPRAGAAFFFAAAAWPVRFAAAPGAVMCHRAVISGTDSATAAKVFNMRYLHTMIRVGNLDAALDFFCTKLGLEEVRRVENDKGRFSLVFLATPGDAANVSGEKISGLSPMIELTYNWDETEYSGGRNFGHLAYAVEDIYALCAKLMAAGVTINRPPRDGHMAFIRSPDGISVELLQQGDALPAQEPWSSMANSGSW
jgi:lactoylglutathione lyase